MRILLRLTVCICVIAAAAAAAASAAVVPPPPRAQLARFSCQHALDPANRSMAVRAVMRPLAGTRRLAIKVDLLQRVGSAAATALHGGDLGVWVSPASPTLGQVPGDVWRLEKSVIDLPAPATYRFRVAFRWVGASGKTLGSAVRYSRRCWQPELRPDLTVTSLTAGPVAGRPHVNLYTAVIANQGRTGAGPFEVLFVPGGGGPATTIDVGFLGAGRERTLSFVGPVCSPSEPPAVTVDAAHQVDDDNRANNTESAVCPSSGTALRR